MKKFIVWLLNAVFYKVYGTRTVQDSNFVKLNINLSGE